jgi:signal transduction histidine kinase
MSVMDEFDNYWNLLVVGANKDSRLQLNNWLEQEGCSVHLASSSEEAYDSFLRQTFEAVFLDLPEEVDSSLELLERFHNLAPEIPVITLGQSVVRTAVMERGAFGVLDKPTDRSQLQQVLLQARIYRALARERRHALEKAQADTKFFEDVLRSVGEGILVFDSKGCVRYQNEKARSLLGEQGWDESEEEEEYLEVNFHKSVVSQILQLLASALTENKEERRILVFDNEARRVHLEVQTVQLRTADGQPQGAIAVLKDRSTEMLLEEQLVHTERLATLGGLLASIAHDIHNPLGCVTGCAEIGIEAAVEADQAASQTRDEKAASALRAAARDMRELFDQIQEAGLRCQNIADNLLAYSRNSTLGRQRTDINQTLRKTVDFVSRYRKKLNGVSVDYQFESTLPLANVNETELSQAFTNLIDNAVQAMEESDRKRLKLSSRSDGRNVIIEILDTGPGIPERRLKKIWTPFFTTRGSGTGLGLHITKRVIEHQNGTISVSSKVGEGTCFTIKLPLA